LAWWNCKDLEEYWKLWNMPVHTWFIRHLYNPILKRGISRVYANFITFFVSALAHEWIVSCALGVFGYQAFLAMLL
jgi:diacylglycerol O-acyltransferase 1